MGKIKRFINKTRILLNYNFDDKFSENIQKNTKKFEDLEARIMGNSNYTNQQIDSINQRLDNISNQLTTVQNSNNYFTRQFSYGSLEYLNHSITTDKKKVIVCGFYGAHNFGDELMLNVLLEKLRKYKNIDITVMLCDKYDIDITKYGAVKFVHYPMSIYDLNTVAMQYDCLLFGGGALLDDVGYKVTSPEKQLSLGYILINLTMRFITFNKTTILYGLSTNYELSDKDFISKLSYIAENATYFSLRDTNSFETLKRANINVSKIKLVDDLVFNYDFSQIPEAKKENEYKIGLMFICNDDNKEYIYKQVKILKKYLKNANVNYILNFIVFYNNSNCDYNFYTKLVKDLKIENYIITNGDIKFDEVKNNISSNDAIITMRYHGSLISNMLGVPTLTLINENHPHYLNKMGYLKSNYKFNGLFVKEVSIKILNELCSSKRSRKDISFVDVTDQQINEAIKLIGLNN